MEAVVQDELFSVLQEKARARSALREMLDAIEVHGPLLPRAMVPLVVELSKQRISQLVAERRLATVSVRGREFVPVAAIEMFLADERKAGRPVDTLSIADSYRKHIGKNSRK